MSWATSGSAPAPERVAVDARHGRRAGARRARPAAGPARRSPPTPSSSAARWRATERSTASAAARCSPTRRAYGRRDARLEGHPDRSEEQRRGAVAVARVEQVEGPARCSTGSPCAGRRRAPPAPRCRARRRARPRAARGRAAPSRAGRRSRAALLVLVDVGQRRHREQQAQAGLGLGLGERQPVAVEVEAVGVDPRVHLVAIGVLDGEHDDDHAAQAAGRGSPGEVAQQAQVGVGAAGLVAVHRARQPDDRGRVAGAARAPGAHRAQPRQGGAQTIRRQGRGDRVAQRPTLDAEAGDAGADHGRGARHGADVGVDLRGARGVVGGGRRGDGRARGARGGRRGERAERERERRRPPHRAGSTTSLRASPALGACRAPARSSRPTTSPASACQSTSPAASSASARSTSARVW